MTTLTEVRALSEPLRGYNFMFIVPNVPGGGSGEILRLSCKTATIPGLGNEPIEDALPGGHILKYPGLVAYSRTLSVEYRENSNLTNYSTLYRWCGLQWHPTTGAQQPATSYKTNAILRILNPQKAVTSTFRFEGVFVENIDEISLDAASADVVSTPVTFSWDRFLQDGGGDLASVIGSAITSRIGSRASSVLSGIIN